MSRSYPRVEAEKRTRNTIWLKRRAAQRSKAQRAFDRAAKQLVTWGRSM